MTKHKYIHIQEAAHNNLKNITLKIPRNQISVITGISGSGKSSLVYDVIFREGNRRFLQSYSAYHRTQLGKAGKPKVGKITGLSPVLAADAKGFFGNPRSTLGTITGIYDMFRLLFARLGQYNYTQYKTSPTRSNFSFNLPQGWCSVCKGLGVEDKINPELLIADPNKTIREGALKISTPTGYMVYSQVTIDVLNQVCESEGFHVDIPWRELTDAQKNIVLNGSAKIKIPYGKHTLESRMKWSGITAKPREEGYYKGILPVMKEILKRDRNKNILRFAETTPCSVCNGHRLNKESLHIAVAGYSIAHFTEMSIDELSGFMNKPEFGALNKNEVFSQIKKSIVESCNLLLELGLGYLSLSRPTDSLSTGEQRRLKLARIAGSHLQGLTYILDEPSVGLHPYDNNNLLAVIDKLKQKGNTVLLVEHEEETMRMADHLVDIGPESGSKGGQIVFQGNANEANEDEIMKSKTLQFLHGKIQIDLKPKKDIQFLPEIKIKNAYANNLKNIDVNFKVGALNVISGVSGAGKTSLMKHVLAHNFLAAKQANAKLQYCDSISGLEKIESISEITASPIGKTPRSNPATYTKLSDHIRNAFAATPQAKESGYKKSYFSFNTAGGRCEVCEGSGKKVVGMHFLGNVEIPCEACNGKRFHDEILKINLSGKNIAEVLDLSVEEALDFFSENKKALPYLQIMNDLGLGYLKLGQSSSTLSGGEAQRIKLAAELVKGRKSNKLFLLDEPTKGLHSSDVAKLLCSLQKLTNAGHTLVCIEHDTHFIKAADWHIDLGQGSGKNGGSLIFEGITTEFKTNKISRTAEYLWGKAQNYISKKKEKTAREEIVFEGITTHNLKNISVHIPKNKITVVTGVSGSGKSSLIFDTIFAECRNQYFSNFPAYAINGLQSGEKATFESEGGLIPAIALNQKAGRINIRSTVGTLTDTADLLRLLFARAADQLLPGQIIESSIFSFNHRKGACTACNGLGQQTVCNSDSLITHPELSILNGAMKGHKTGRFYGDPHGQYIATLEAVAAQYGFDLSKPWAELSEFEKNVILNGTKNLEYQVVWNYKRKNRTGQHNFTTIWKGFLELINEEFIQKQQNTRGSELQVLMHNISCTECNGTRLNKAQLAYTIAGKTFSEISNYSFNELKHQISEWQNGTSFSENQKTISQEIFDELFQKITNIEAVGLSYLSLSRNSSGISAGEMQRLLLANQLSNGLTDILYVLDEPTAGLHPADSQKLMKMLHELAENGNTVLVAEHDNVIIEQADHIIELGPNAGEQGGHLIFEGNIETLLDKTNSLTGKYLQKHVPNIMDKKTNIFADFISVSEANLHNLKNISTNFPLNCFTVVTGVSGSGKTSLVFGSLLNQLQAKSSSEQFFDKIIAIGKSRISTGHGSMPVSYIGIFDEIRKEFAATQIAKEKGIKASAFSVNNKGGRCETCKGKGYLITELDFLQNITQKCPACEGKRYTDEVLACKLNNNNISDILEMTITKAQTIFNNKKILNGLKMLVRAGLGYLKLGRDVHSLSGGEQKRLYLANEILHANGKRNLYLFDEPTVGLHPHDVNRLLKLFNELLNQGHTIIAVEHNMQVAQNAHYIIDMGPGAGTDGGEIMAVGSPKEIADNPKSTTGRYL